MRDSGNLHMGTEALRADAEAPEREADRASGSGSAYRCTECGALRKSEI